MSAKANRDHSTRARCFSRSAQMNLPDRPLHFNPIHKNVSGNIGANL
jgi:hypothetical protein